MGYYSPNPHYAPDDFSEDAERLEACEQEAGRYFASVTSRQKTEFDNRMAYIRPWSGSPRWEREKAAAQRRWDETTAEARALLDRTVHELMLTGEVGPDLDAEWVQLASKEAAKSIDAFRALGGRFVWETEAEQVPAASGLIPIVTTWKADKTYYRYICVRCGDEGRNTYCEPDYTQMMERRLCWNCNYWVEEEKRYEKEHRTMTIIDGHVYGPGSRTSGSMRGMAGRRFDIEYIEPSAYAGQRVTTFDLWSGSTMPDHLRARFPDTARFLGGAERAQVGETTCWNPSDRKSEPYPLPNTLRPNIAASKTGGAEHG